MATKVETSKTTLEHMESGAKYVGSAVTLSAAIVGILMFFKPDWQPIAAYLGSVLTFIINMILIVVFKGKENVGTN